MWAAYIYVLVAGYAIIELSRSQAVLWLPSQNCQSWAYWLFQLKSFNSRVAFSYPSLKMEILSFLKVSLWGRLTVRELYIQLPIENGYVMRNYCFSFFWKDLIFKIILLVSNFYMSVQGCHYLVLLLYITINCEMY